MHAPCAAAQDRIPTLEPLIDTCILRVPDLLQLYESYEFWPARRCVNEGRSGSFDSDSTRESLIDTCQTMGRFIRHTPREFMLTCVHILVGNCLYHVEPSWDFFPYSASDSSSKDTFRGPGLRCWLGHNLRGYFSKPGCSPEFRIEILLLSRTEKLFKFRQIWQNKY